MAHLKGMVINTASGGLTEIGNTWLSLPVLGSNGPNMSHQSSIFHLKRHKQILNCIYKSSQLIQFHL